MSQVRTRKVVKVVETSVDVQTTTITGLNTVVNSVVTNMQSDSLKEVIGNEHKSKQITNVLMSPATLKDSFRKEYKINLDTISATINGLDKHKAAVIKTMQNSIMRVKDESAVQNGLEKIINARDFNTFKQVVNDTMNKVSVEHTKVFSQNIAEAVKKASINVGFKNVEIQDEASKISIISQNDLGEAILTEVRVDNDKVDLVSETIGMQDNSCNLKLNEFDRELERMGIKFKDAKAKWTGGNSWLPKAKEVEKNMKKKHTEKSMKKKQNDIIKRYNKSMNNKLKN